MKILLSATLLTSSMQSRLKGSLALWHTSRVSMLDWPLAYVLIQFTTSVWASCHRWSCWDGQESCHCYQVHTSVSNLDFIHILDQFWVHVYQTDGNLEFDQGGNTAILMLLNVMNNTINALNNTVNGLDWQLSRIDVVMENARIVKRNQHLQSLGPGQVCSSHQKEVSIFTVLHWPCFNNVICRSLALEQLLHNRSMEVLLYLLTLISTPQSM